MSGQGDCYKVAAETAMRLDLLLCHGRPVYRGSETPDPDGRFGHAWCETKDGESVVDYSNGLSVDMPRELYYAIGNIVEDDVVRFTADQTRHNILSEKVWGPWPQKVSHP
jgi:hypothetical protein